MDKDKIVDPGPTSEGISDVRRFLARLALAYRVKLDSDERKYYAEKLGAYKLTREQWDAAEDLITRERYTFPELPILHEYLTWFERKTRPTTAFRLVDKDGIKVAIKDTSR